MNGIFSENTAFAKVVADSVWHGRRLVSVEATFPRPFLAEFNTHRILSRNSASSRAIPVWKRLLSVLDVPYVPVAFGLNKGGMAADATLSPADQEIAVRNWLIGRDLACMQAYCLIGGEQQVLSDAKETGRDQALELNRRMAEIFMRYPDAAKWLTVQTAAVHKQHANRPLEPYAFHTVIITSCYWRNFLGLRASAKAQPEANDFGIAIGRAIMNSTPRELKSGEWHLPYITDDDRAFETDELTLARIACARCARLSYLAHEGHRLHAADLRMVDGLQANGHMSPFEHPARAIDELDLRLCGNFAPYWEQYRKTLPHEDDFSRLVTREDLLLGCRGDERLTDFIVDYPYEAPLAC